MKKIFCFLTTLFVIFSLSAQETHVGHYYHQGKTNEIPINTNVALVYFRTTQVDTTSIRESYNCLQKITLNGAKADTLYACEVELPSNSYDENIAWLQNQPEVFDVEPIIGTDPHILVSNVFYVKLHDISDTSLLKSEAARYGVHYEGALFKAKLWYQLSVNKYSMADALTISTQMGESGYFSMVDPGFIFNVELYDWCVTDDNFDDQWGMAAINACEAWNITTGSSNTKVAVIDQGVDASHSEFCYTNVVSTYDVSSLTSPSTIWGDHGTHVAGIIFANHNEGEIAGIAPGTSLIDISDSMRGLAENFIFRMSIAFNEAVQRGADIINCSWGIINNISGMSIVPQLMEDAIHDALENGRNGKGCIVVFAAGNRENYWQSYDVRYPANSIDEIIVVGSIESNYLRSSFSCYGSQLDIVAPGSYIYSTIPNQSYGIKSGTSMAAPHVAGVVALMLSENPNLTRKQVDRIIKGTAQKIGGYTYGYNSQQPVGSWNSEVGHGLIDAFAAVEQAQSTSSYDLYIKDASSDNGDEPNGTNSSVNNSPDIKVYLEGTTTEVSSLTLGNTYTIKTTIRNLSNSSILLQRSKIKIYWTVATPTFWNDSWTNAGNICGYPKGGVLSPTGFTPLLLPANGSTTVNVTLTVPTYSSQMCMSPAFSTISFLAVVDDGQIIIGEQHSNYPTESFVKINNNVAWHSFGVIDPLIPIPPLAITSVSPNPSVGNVTIEYHLPEDISSANMYIKNNYGQTVFYETVYSNGEKVNVHNLDNGTYYVLLEYDGTVLGHSVLLVN